MPARITMATTHKEEAGGSDFSYSNERERGERESKFTVGGNTSTPGLS